MKKQKQRRAKEARLSPVFKATFFAILALTLLSSIVSVTIAFQSHVSEAQLRLLDTCTIIWHLGFGAIVGLMAAIPLQSRET